MQQNSKISEWARKVAALRKTESEKIDLAKEKGEYVIEISADKPHLSDLLRFYYLAIQKEKVSIVFADGQVDDKGKLTAQLPSYDDLTEDQVDDYIEKYIAEGVEMRKILGEYLRDDDSSDVVLAQSKIFEKIEEKFLKKRIS